MGLMWGLVGQSVPPKRAWDTLSHLHVTLVLREMITERDAGRAGARTRVDFFGWDCWDVWD
jgi:hypothetical protein